MDADDEYPWLTTAWFAEMTHFRDRVTLTPEGLAELMAKYQSPGLIRIHMGVEAGALLGELDPFAPGRPVPADVVAGVKLLAELNCWEILSVVLEEGTELSSGTAATALMRAAFDPLEGVFTFSRQAQLDPIGPCQPSTPQVGSKS